MQPAAEWNRLHRKSEIYILYSIDPLCIAFCRKLHNVSIKDVSSARMFFNNCRELKLSQNISKYP